jgi:hypothetical protein
VHSALISAPVLLVAPLPAPPPLCLAYLIADTPLPPSPLTGCLHCALSLCGRFDDDGLRVLDVTAFPSGAAPADGLSLHVCWWLARAVEGGAPAVQAQGQTQGQAQGQVYWVDGWAGEDVSNWQVHTSSLRATAGVNVLWWIRVGTNSSHPSTNSECGNHLPSHQSTICRLSCSCSWC